MPILSVRLFDYETLKTKLKPTDRIVIASCDGCARLSADLGGATGLNNLADQLAADGFHVVHRALIHFACAPEHWEEHLADESVRALLEEADVIIPLACDAGEKLTHETLPGVTLLRVTKTLGKGAHAPETGARLTEPADDTPLDIDDPEGLPLNDAAKHLGLHPGSF